MKVSRDKTHLLLSLDSSESDIIISMLKYMAYDAPLDQKHCEMRFGVDRDSIQRLYDELHSKLP